MIVKGKFKFILIDAETGEEEEFDAPNTFSDLGNQYVAGIIAGVNDRLGPGNDALRCRLKSASDDNVGIFTSATGPMTGPVYVLNGAIVGSGAGGVPSGFEGFLYQNIYRPIKLQWVNPDSDAYSVHSVEIRNGSEVLSTAVLGSLFQKPAGKFLRLVWVGSLTLSGKFSAEASEGLERLIGGATGISSGWSARIKRTQDRFAEGDIAGPNYDLDNPDRVTFLVGYGSRTITSKTGFQVFLGSYKIFDYDDATIGTGQQWAITITVGIAAGGLSVNVNPRSVYLNSGIDNRYVSVVASGGDGAWSIDRRIRYIQGSSGIGTTLHTTDQDGNNLPAGSWRINVRREGRANANAFLDITVRRGSDSIDASVSVTVEYV